MHKHQYFQVEFSNILRLQTLGTVAIEESNRQLAELMSSMERTFNIPMLKNIDWEKANPDIANLYKNISLARIFD